MAQDDMSASDVPLEGGSNPLSAPARVVGENRSVLGGTRRTSWRPPTSSIRFQGVSGCVCRRSKPIRTWSADYKHCSRRKLESLK